MPWLPWDPSLLVFINQLFTQVLCHASIFESLLERQGQVPYQRKAIINLQETKLL